MAALLKNVKPTTSTVPILLEKKNRALLFSTTKYLIFQFLLFWFLFIWSHMIVQLF